MAYQVLARKWRPQVFDDVVGQEHIADVLKNSIATGRIHHGYLFTGIRGIGKTTTARILAKALNCEHGPTPTPCNGCEFCREITNGYSMDVEEIDAASNRGVDDVRVLQDNVNYAPSRSRYKIFIIDEVHMLTKEAFNALLKTLEEPPGNVVFIMATTEIWKIPMTILSRCQQFKFKNGSPEQVIALLKKIAAHERRIISDKSLSLLAKTSGGSVRDAENLLDQVFSFCDNVVRDHEVRYVLGIPEQRLIHAFLSAILEHRAAHLFTLMERLVSGGYNLRLFCMELLERVRNLIVLKTASDADKYLTLFDYSRQDLEQFAALTSLSELQQLYWMLADVEREMKFSPNPRLILEMALTRMARVQALTPLPDMVRQLQQQLPEASPGVPHVRERSAEMLQEARPAAAMPPVASFQPPQDVERVWNDLLARVNAERKSLAPSLKKAIPVELTAQELVLGFHQDAEFMRNTVENPKNQAFLNELLQAYFGRPMRIKTTIHHAAASFEAIREQHEQRLAELPRFEAPPPDAAPRQASASMPSRPKQDWQTKGGDGGWQRRESKSSYKPPVEISVQEVVRMFEGTIVD